MKKFIINNPALSFLLSIEIGSIVGAFSSCYNFILWPFVWFMVTTPLSWYVFHTLVNSIDDIPFSDPPKEIPTEDDLRVIE